MPIFVLFVSAGVLFEGAFFLWVSLILWNLIIYLLQSHRQIIRSHWQVSHKKNLLRILCRVRRNTPLPVCLFNKVAGVNTFLWDTSGWLSIVDTYIIFEIRVWQIQEFSFMSLRSQDWHKSCFLIDQQFFICRKSYETRRKIITSKYGLAATRGMRKNFSYETFLFSFPLSKSILFKFEALAPNDVGVILIFLCF